MVAQRVSEMELRAGGLVLEMLRDDYAAPPRAMIETHQCIAAIEAIESPQGPAWYVAMLVGDISEAIARAPHYRPFVCWQRRKTRRLHLCRTERISRLLKHGKLQR